MLENPSISHYYNYSKNVLSADNQQERLFVKTKRILRDYTPKL